METKNLRKTPLYDKHVNLGARMIEFGEWVMPVEYSGILKEHRATRLGAGIFDLTHMGELKVTGPDAFGLVQKLTTNDISKLAVNQILYTTVCKEDGGVLDDILVYRRTDHYFLVVNATNVKKMYEWFSRWASANTKVENLSDELSLIAVQGPCSESIVQKITQTNLSSVKYYNCIDAKINAVGAIRELPLLISRTGYTGEDGFELYIPNKSAADIWDMLMSAGKDAGMIPIGLGARDTLRLEAKYCLYGNEINENINPIEAGLSWVVKLDNGDFIGKAAMENLKRDRFLVGFKMLDKGIPRTGYEVYDEN
ncbi:MAG: glycine cleavage system aminomethyltransferase GcvT, partial [Pseudomonadota bacterium]